MKIKELSKRFDCSDRTVQRWIQAYNKKNGRSHPYGQRDDITDEKLLTFLESKTEGEKELPEQPKPEENPNKDPDGDENKKPTPRPKRQKTVNRAKKKHLQEKFSADWLVVTVLVTILGADMFAFGAIGFNEFGEKAGGWWVCIPFALMGLATGFGSVVTYNRISDEKLAVWWKSIFGTLQFTVFALVVNEQWFWAELVMTSMFVIVFIGVQRSVKG